MSQQQQRREIPDGYERVEHHDQLTLHDPDRGIIISVIERDRLSCELYDRYPWKVSAAREQEGFYDGSFQSRSHAEDKAFELARDH